MNNLRLPADIQAVTLSAGSQWRCGVALSCTEYLSFPPTEPEDTPFLIEENHYCVGCIQIVFQQAIDDESSWPACIKNKTLDINRFAGLIDPAFIARYNAQEAMYNDGPEGSRIRCPHIPGSTGPCREYIGIRLHESGPLQWQQCRSCGGNVCMVCGGPQPTDLTEHVCNRQRTQDQEQMRNGPDRGYRYQICPRCERVFSKELDIECNHMR